MKLILLILFLHLPVLGSDLKVLSWNVFMIPKPINFTLQEQRTIQMIHSLNQEDYDLLFFQEAFSKKFRKTISKALNPNYPYSFYLKKSPRPWHFINSGLLIFSKYPFLVLDTLYFRKCTHSDCLSSKGATLIEVNQNSNKIQFLTTHTQAWDDEKAQEVRKTQFLEIKKLLLRHQKWGVDQYLLGDLNIDRNAIHEYPFILSLLDMQDFSLSGDLNYTNGFKIDCYKTPGGTANQWLDHLWGSSQNTKTDVTYVAVKEFNGNFSNKECSLSDHHAIEAHIKL